MMKLSEQTLAVLKNFATINSGVVLKPGKVQKTISAEKSILVEAELEDITDHEFGIYDLNQFLGNIITLKNPNLDFGEQTVVMTDEDGTKMDYRACAAELVISPPTKELTLDSPDVVFDLSNSTFVKLMRLGAMNALPNLTIAGKDGELKASVHEKNNDTSNMASTTIGAWSGEDFTASFKTELLKMLPDDYKVEIKLGGFAKFSSTTKNLVYFISLEIK
jgi:hypothetical protein